MKFIDYIEAGAKKIGSHNKLAAEIGLTQANLWSIKAGKRAMPDEACVKLGVIIGLENPIDMIAIQRASRAKTEEEASFWTPFVQNVRMHSHAVGIVALACAATIAGVTALRETRSLTDVSATLHIGGYQNSIMTADFRPSDNLNKHYQRNVLLQMLAALGYLFAKYRRRSRSYSSILACSV